jgi:hypothetical protein
MKIPRNISIVTERWKFLISCQDFEEIIIEILGNPPSDSLKRYKTGEATSPSRN